MKTYSIVGMNFTKSEDFVKALQPGTPVTLIREPNNAFDKNAVAVWIEGRKVGFIPKKQNAVLAQFIDQDGADIGGLAMDGVTDAGLGKYTSAKFVRSPDSGYPMVEV